MDSGGNDFERNSTKKYTFGTGSNVLNPQENDPSKPHLDAEDLDMFPVYLRFEPSGDSPDWNVEEVTVIVNPGPSEIKYYRLRGNSRIWLGQHSGKMLYLKKG